MDTKQLLGKRIKELIKKKGISQEKLAEMIGVEPTALSNIVTGRNYPLFTTLEKIIKVLDVNFTDVFCFEHHGANENLKEEIIKLIDKNPEKLKEIYKSAMHNVMIYNTSTQENVTQEFTIVVNVFLSGKEYNIL